MSAETAGAERLRVAEAVRAACVQTALDAYQDARFAGLCHEGAWEVAVDALRGLDLAALVGDGSSPCGGSGE